MTVKILKLLLIMFVSLTLAGCSAKEIVYVDKPVEVQVPVKCNIPEVTCDFNKETDTEVIESLLQCITNLKRAMEVCK